jgi:hypothetical protein
MIVIHVPVRLHTANSNTIADDVDARTEAGIAIMAQALL